MSESEQRKYTFKLQPWPKYLGPTKREQAGGRGGGASLGNPKKKRCANMLKISKATRPASFAFSLQGVASGATFGGHFGTIDHFEIFVVFPAIDLNAFPLFPLAARGLQRLRLFGY